MTAMPVATELPRPSGRLPAPVLGMLILVVTEAMFFAGLMSAFSIVRGQAPGGIWPPPGQPRLPVQATLLNTLVLLASGLAFWRARAAFGDGQGGDEVKRSSIRLFGAALLLGALFLGLQGVEWVGLLREGLSARGSVHGGFFFAIVGAHALHVVVALGVLGAMFARLRGGKLSPGTFSGMVVLWTFVVALWPVIYLRVYL